MKRILLTSLIIGLASQFVGAVPMISSTPEQTTGTSQKPPPTRTNPTKPDPTQPAKGDPIFGGRGAGPGAPNAAAAAAAAVQPYDYTFPSGIGMLFFYVKPDKGANFESVVARIKEILDSSQDTARKQQAAGWKIYKSLETPKEGLIYVFLFDPAIVGVDYDPVKLLSESMPAELQGLYDRLVDALIRVERMGLAKIR